MCGAPATGRTRLNTMRTKLLLPAVLVLGLLGLLVPEAGAEILTPPYFNLAEGRKITATATCGDDEAELYCKLVGANAENDENINVIQGQVCDFCDPNNPTKNHPPENAVDGRETWWQSPPLSRGMKYNEVNLTIDLGQEFHVAYVFVRMGNSPRPGLWALEKSSDYGKTYKPWQYFSDSASDCETHFGKESLNPITRDDSVICNTEYSKIVPLEGGEIPILLLVNRPSANKYFNSSVLQEWTRATNVRLRLLRTKTLLGHLMSVARQDPTVTRRYFYSIKDVSIGGRCMCNGHADTCDIPDLADPKKLLCRCQHHTCGPQCAYCCPGFEQKAWRISQLWQKFVCEPCNCFNHSSECSYDADVNAQRLSLDIHGNYEGGGVCKNCQHNTEGINCNKCKPTYYRPHGKHWNETDVCQPCDCQYSYSTGNCAEGQGQCECRKEFQEPYCDACSYGYFDFPNCKPCPCNLNGTQGDFCEPRDEVCPCKYNYAGTFCEQCADGYYNFPACEECSCNPTGSLTAACDQKSGNCTCKNNFSGRTCDQCEAGYYNYPSCKYCNCDASGTLAGICNATTGTCLCKEGFGGPRCDQCIPGYYSELRGREQVCVKCGCSIKGSTTTSCDAGTGKCECAFNFAGKQCDQCSPGYYNLEMNCLGCNCDSLGAIGVSCDQEGQCQCRGNFDNTQCNICKEGFYNFPICEECNCDPAGVIQSFAGCGSVPAGELCQCKERVQGRICNECRPLYWDLQQNNPAGCIDCECYNPGTQGGIGVCDSKTGLCTCKYSVGERSCRGCKDGSYNLTQENIFGCVDCGCDVGGSVNNICDKSSGQCTCKPRVTGLRCHEPLNIHYFPTLHQYQYEVEDASTPSGNPVRYDYSETRFPGFSWKGYAVFSMTHNTIIQTIFIQKSSLYRMVLRYVNPNPDPIMGKITITPDSANEIEQKFDVLLKPTTTPQFVTVSGAQGINPSPFVMNPGSWDVTFKIDKSLLLDYFVLVPAAYYEATVLTQQVESVCTVGDKGLCRHFGYPDINSYDSVRGAGGFTSRNGVRDRINQYIDYNQQLKELKEPEIPLVDKMQDELSLDLTVTKTGPYVMLIEYVTPVEGGDQTGGTLTVTARGSASQEYAKILLNSCPYTFACRQVVTDESSKVHVFNIQDINVGLSLKGDNETSVGIKSIVVIPYHDWHLDYIKPQPICVRKNGKCVQAEFPLAPYYKKVEFESGPETVAKVRPWNIFDNSTDLVYLSQESPIIDVNSKVPQPGQYVFIVQYYQPDTPEFELDVLIQNGQIYEATLPIKHCPSNSGCRTVVQMPDGVNHFSLTENFLLTIGLGKDPENKEFWLDYLMVIPADHYTESLLDENRLDQTREFISTCGNNHFFINKTNKGFCRDAVFSLTSDYNNGATPCNCDYMGSHSFECEPFGGQCQCRPNVIGQRCQACKTGFYGFPDCKPCDCPSTALCEKDTGDCICPARVSGEKCDQCTPYTYGFDPIIGCEDCNCDALGVVDNQLQCDLNTGMCECKANIVGRTCSSCTPGHYLFPYCDKCSCDVTGTTPEICDQSTAECFCKDNVNGQQCETCKDGNFDLQESSEAGCTKCFCFGKTTRCGSANLYWSEQTQMNNWYLVNIAVTPNNISVVGHQKPPTEVNDKTIGVELTSNESVNRTVYFGAPREYLSNKLSSYGGALQYYIFYTTGPFGNAVSQGDVVLEGADIWLVHSGIEQPPATTYWQKTLELRETEFVTLSGQPATRELFMTVLEDLQGIYIRATYWESSVTTRLQNVSMQVGMETWDEDADKATSVEDCQCPPNYSGYSCEECADGYYRVSSGPHGGFCVPCQCHGHTQTCDVNTGVCIDCQHSTQGDHCDQCIEGYHGNALAGSPNDCLICACPLPLTSNNFATSCEVSEDGDSITCKCREGYFGARCESCDSGFYGTPQQPGETCSSCQCSGNINPMDRSSCDTITGDCLKCMNNTYGAACGLCQPGYYGDAIILKDCQVCLCDTIGMERCDSYSGICVCKPGVIGDKCDRCEVEHWGFESGQGCTACGCSVAAQSKQCDDTTGQCKCMPGVTGKQCEKCASGFWNFSPSGCVTCECNTGYSIGLGCNASTGHCECLPGVIGDKCDHCPYRNVLKPEEGCFACDSCTHHLLNSTDSLQLLIDPVMTDFENKASGYFTAQRLVYITDQVKTITPSVEALDPNKFDLSDTSLEIDVLETDGKNLDRKADFAASDAERLKVNAGDLLIQCYAVLNDVDQSKVKSEATVDHVWNLASSIETGEWQGIDNAMAEANQLLSDIKAYDLSPQTNISDTQLENAQKLMERMQKFIEPVSAQSKVFKDLRDKVDVFVGKLDDIVDYTKAVEKKAEKAEGLNSKNRDAQKELETKKLEFVNSVKKESEKDLSFARDYLLNGSYALNDAGNSVSAAGRELNEGFRINNIFNENIEERNSQLDELNQLFYQAADHMEVLISKSTQLNDLYESSKNNTQTEHAVRGASAYPDIVKEINAAREAAEAAASAIQNSTELTKGLGDRIAISKDNSTKLYQEALDALLKVQSELKPQLTEAENAVHSIKDLNQQTDDSNSAIIQSITSIPLMTLGPFIDDATRDSKLVNQTAKEIKETMNKVNQYLPNSLKQISQLPKDVDKTLKSTELIKSQLANVKQTQPNITNLVKSVSEKQQRMEADKKAAENNIEKLRKAVALAKELANSIKIGVEFEPSTLLELKPPDNVDELGTSTHVSAYFRTPKENGFLMYLGNQDGTKLRRTKTDDFMALEIVDGKPTLHWDIGGSPEKLTSDKRVDDNVWYQVIVDRVGKNVKMTIREELPGGKEQLHVTEKVLPGMNTIFNLHKDQSKLFVGGYQGGPNQYKIQDNVQFSSFEGQIEELVIGDTPVGLWNFVDAQGNSTGARERDKLVNQQPNTGYRFDGEGYAIIDSSSYIKPETSDINLKFKTFAKEGLLFLAGNEDTFLSIEMRDGKVYLQYRLGGTVLTMGSLESYNDGRWHTLSASRYHKKGELKIDDVVIGRDEADGERVLLEVTNRIYFGGYPNKHNYIEVINTGFDGCIDDVFVSGTPVDLSQNKEAFGVNPGCPVKFARLVSFEEQGQGYIRKPNVSSSNQFQLSLKFKTAAKNGLIFYATNRDQSAGISLSLVEGALVAISQQERLTTGSNLYNDDLWHVVTTTHDKQVLSIVVDDYDDYRSDGPPPGLHFMYGDLYIGGVPPNYNINLLGSATRSFSGCLGDATINGAIINFANATNKHGETLGRCSKEPKKAVAVLVTPPRVAPIIPKKEILEAEIDDITKPPPVRKNVTRLQPIRPPVPVIPETRGDFKPKDLVTTVKPVVRKPDWAAERAKLPAPTVNDNCAYGSGAAKSGNLIDGLRFGSQPDSRIEFDKLPARYKNSFDFSVEFNTTADGGVIFYAADRSHKDFVTLFMREGKIHFGYNCGTGPARLVSPRTYNDGEWHSVSFSREALNGKLTVDEELVAEGKSQGSSNAIIMQGPFFLGGLANVTVEIKYNLQDYYSPFHGCIRNFAMSGQPVNNIKTQVGALSCLQKFEDGIYFGGKGYLKLLSNFKVGLQLEISMEIKTRQTSGILLSIHGKRDFLILEIFNNTIMARVDNGEGPFQASYKLSNQYLLCDGNWHTIQILKSKYVVSVAVDKHFSDPGVGSGPTTNTKSSIFIGGHPYSSRIRGSRSLTDFTGCMRNLKIREQTVDIPEDKAHGNVRIGACPAD